HPRPTAAAVLPVLGHLGAVRNGSEPVPPASHRHAERGDIEGELLARDRGHGAAGGEPDERSAPVEPDEAGGDPVAARPHPRREALGTPACHPAYVGYGAVHRP